MRRASSGWISCAWARRSPAWGRTPRLQDVAEPIPGPATKRLGEAAQKNKIWVVAGLTERVGDIVYNTAVLLDRQGRVAGKYRKTHLPREEWKEGVRPGQEYPVFDTDFGRVAIQICYDWFFPEPAAIFALKGAEIILCPDLGQYPARPRRHGRWRDDVPRPGPGQRGLHGAVRLRRQQPRDRPDGPDSGLERRPRGRLLGRGGPEQTRMSRLGGVLAFHRPARSHAGDV